jgi:Zn-dependent protease with chaperone function
MNFIIDRAPPTEDEILTERERLGKQIKRIKNQDTVITFILILISSIVLSFVTYSYTDNIKYAAIAFSIFPIIGLVMALVGLITAVGFRSNAMRMIEMRNERISLNPVSDESMGDVLRLSEKYVQVDIYRRKVADMGRSLVNGELALFWEWDASTQAKTAKQRAYLENARESMDMSAEATPLH